MSLSSISRLPSASGCVAPGLGVKEDQASFNSLLSLSKSSDIGTLPSNLAKTWGLAIPGIYLPLTPNPYTKWVPDWAAACAKVAAIIVGVCTAELANCNISSFAKLVEDFSHDIHLKKEHILSIWNYSYCIWSNIHIRTWSNYVYECLLQ